jgi:hypothetical protein
VKRSLHVSMEAMYGIEADLQVEYVLMIDNPPSCPHAESSMIVKVRFCW